MSAYYDSTDAQTACDVLLDLIAEWKQELLSRIDDYDGPGAEIRLRYINHGMCIIDSIRAKYDLEDK